MIFYIESELKKISNLYTYIDSIEDLACLNQELLQKSFVGIDTEFRRTTKDNMRLALLQVNDGEEIYLIDTILIGDPEGHASFLFSEYVTKVIHSCKEDLEAVYSWTKKVMANIFDTQIANSFLDGEFTIGYQGLVEQELEITLEKNETRSNWLRRPLSDSQLKYAALDVEYLIHLYELQKEALSKTSKLDWLYQDINRLLEITFDARFSFKQLERSVSKTEEARILYKFDKVVQDISKRENINPTLFFSKKSQKEFLRLVFLEGLDSASKEITSWRRHLIKDDFLTILK